MSLVGSVQTSSPSLSGSTASGSTASGSPTAGVGWMLGGQIVVLGLGFLKLAFLARMLPPQEMGVFLLGLATVGVLESVSEFGLDRDLVQRASVSPSDLGAVWLIQAIRGALVAVILLGVAPLAARMLDVQGLAAVVVAFGVASAARGLRTPTHALEERQMRFRRIASFDAIVAVVDLLAVFALARFVPLAESACWGTAAVQLAAAGASWLVFRGTVSLRPERGAWSRLGRVARQFSTTGALTYVMSRLDDLLVARVLGAVDVATWGLGYRLSELPIRLTAQAGTRPATSMFARLADRPDELRHAFLRWFTAQQTVIVAFAAGALATGPAVVRLVWGDEWAGAGTIVQLLALAVVGRGATHAVAPLLIGTGRYELIVRLKWFEALAFLCSFVPLLLKFGLAGASVGVGVGYGIALLVRVGVLHRYGFAHPTALLRAWLRAGIPAVGAAVVTGALVQVAPADSAVVDMAQIALFVLSWLGFLGLLFRQSPVALIRQIAQARFDDPPSST